MEKQFIKAKNYKEDGVSYAPSVCFRKKFALKKSGRYTLSVCALGFGYVTVNGEKVAEDLFLAPVSDYRKTLWVNEFDVTKLLKDGENEIFVEVGNGFFNEGIETVWGHYKAAWRGEPTLCLSLANDGKDVVKTGEDWEAALSTKTVFNELRSGEYFDARGGELHFENAVQNQTPPTGEFRLCDCEPILEAERILPTDISKSKDGWIFDFGKNISGYAELCACEEAGRELTLKYAEEIDETGELQINGLNVFQKAPFQTDKVICNGEKLVWKPKFTYHGFRFVEVIGLQNPPTEEMLTAIFIKQALERRGEFTCSDETLNKIYAAGIAATESNLFYSLTDCPTREKLGWTNDAQASLEQFLFNFGGEKLLKKWIVDICDTVNADGDLAGVAPSPDWGYGTDGAEPPGSHRLRQPGISAS